MRRFHCHILLLLGRPRWLSGKESACSAGDLRLIPGSWRSPGEGNCNSLLYSCLENSLESTEQELESCFQILIGYSLSSNQYKYDELMVMKTWWGWKNLLNYIVRMYQVQSKYKWGLIVGIGINSNNLVLSCVIASANWNPLQSMGSLTVGPDWATLLSLLCIGEGTGNPLQCFCLENPRDGGAWWAAIYGVAQSRTGLKWLSSSSSSY